MVQLLHYSFVISFACVSKMFDAFVLSFSLALRFDLLFCNKVERLRFGQMVKVMHTAQEIETTSACMNCSNSMLRQIETNDVNVRHGAI